MDNHFHLMVDDPFDNLSKAMQCALTAYAKYFNGKTGRTGHLFDNRYSRVAVESDTQAVQLLDYIHLNPVKGAINSLEAYRWSSSLIINFIRTPPTFIRTCADECGNPIP